MCWGGTPQACKARVHPLELQPQFEYILKIR